MQSAAGASNVSDAQLSVRSPIMTRNLSQVSASQPSQVTGVGAIPRASPPAMTSTGEELKGRPVDRKKSRAAYLGTYRKACRNIFDVVAEPNNGQAVYDLKQEIDKRWLLYVSAHRDFLENTQLDEERTKVYDDHHERYKSDYEDAVRTLDAYLRREAKAEEQAREALYRRHQVEYRTVTDERTRVDREIEQLQRSVD